MLYSDQLKSALAAGIADPDNALTRDLCDKIRGSIVDAEDWDGMTPEEKRQAIEDEFASEIEEALAEEAEAEARQEADEAEYQTWAKTEDALREAEQAAEDLAAELGWTHDLDSYRRAATGSRYMYFARGDDEISVRISDHPQPANGGFLIREDQVLGLVEGRAGESDVCIDIADAAAGLAALREALSR